MFGSIMKAMKSPQVKGTVNKTKGASLEARMALAKASVKHTRFWPVDEHKGTGIYYDNTSVFGETGIGKFLPAICITENRKRIFANQSFLSSVPEDKRNICYEYLTTKLKTGTGSGSNSDIDSVIDYLMGNYNYKISRDELKNLFFPI